MKEIKEEIFESERALFKLNNAKMNSCVFKKGESPLKHSENLSIKDTVFDYKYPMWYNQNIKAENLILNQEARSGLWYAKNVDIRNSSINSPKTFRHSSFIQLDKVFMPNAPETMWFCNDINLNEIQIYGDYFAMNSHNIKADNISINGNYAFDACKNIIIKNSKILSKDAFWNCENVEVYDSYINGEYLAWNSKNIKFINCFIQSLQGLCYIENLFIRNCVLNDSTLLFEYSTVDIDVKSTIKSIFNPKSGIIKAKDIEKINLDKKESDVKSIQIIKRLEK